MAIWSTRPSERKDSVRMFWSGPSFKIWRETADSYNNTPVSDVSLIFFIECCCCWLTHFHNNRGCREKVLHTTVWLCQNFLLLKWETCSESCIKKALSASCNFCLLLMQKNPKDSILWFYFIMLPKLLMNKCTLTNKPYTPLLRG